MFTIFTLRSTTVAILAAAIGVLCLSVSQLQAKDLVLTEQDGGKTVTAILQQTILVQLRGNATTGFTWLLTGTNGNSVSATGPSTYTPDPGGAVGAGGTFSFPFVAQKAGDTTLSFSYERPWEPNSVVQTFSVTINVTDQPLSPRLSVVMKGTHAVISWPITGSSGFYLEGTRTLSSGWAALNVLAIPDGLNYSVTLPLSGQLLFFRLRQ
jgi:predicted secreted protein